MVLPSTPVTIVRPENGQRYAIIPIQNIQVQQRIVRYKYTPLERTIGIGCACCIGPGILTLALFIASAAQGCLQANSDPMNFCDNEPLIGFSIVTGIAFTCCLIAIGIQVASED